MGDHCRPIGVPDAESQPAGASQGMLFERSYTPSAVCCPARAMMLSGAYHWHNGVYNQIHSTPSVHRDMIPDVVLYSQRLREAGYTLGYIGKWHAAANGGPLDFGFHEVADPACDTEMPRRAINEAGRTWSDRGPAPNGCETHDAVAGIRAVHHVGLSGRSRGSGSRNTIWRTAPSG